MSKRKNKMEKNGH